MPFPKTKRVIFERNPIAEAIFQARFPPILQIVSAVPVEFQNNLRAEYPLYEKEESLGVPKEMQEMLSRFDVPRVTDNAVHKFATENGKRCVTLGKDFVALTEQTYLRWEQMRSQIAEALQALESTYRPSFYVRLGLRYRNVIDREALGLQEHPWKDLINRCFVGLLGADADEVPNQIMHVQSAAVFPLDPQIPGAFAVVRYGMESRFRNRFIIDSDFYTEERKVGSDVVKTLDQFNELNGNLFRWAVGDTGPLRDALRPTEID